MIKKIFGLFLVSICLQFLFSNDVFPVDLLSDPSPITLEWTISGDSMGGVDTNLGLTFGVSPETPVSLTGTISWTPAEGYNLTGLSLDVNTPGFTGGLNAKGLSLAGTRTVNYGDVRIDVGTTFSMTHQSGASASGKLSVQRNDANWSFAFGLGPEGGTLSAQAQRDGSSVGVSIAGNNLTVAGKDIKIGQFCTAAYSLDVSGNGSVSLSSQDSNYAEAVADNLVGQVSNGDSSGKGSASENSNDDKKLEVPEGWFLSLSPQEQKAALGIIRHRLGVELAARGWNISEAKLIVGVGGGTDQDGNPKAVVAFGLKFGNASSSSGKKDGAGGGFVGAKSENGNSGVSVAEQHSGLSALVIDISSGGVRATAEITPTQLGFSLSAPGLSFALSRNGDVSANVTIGGVSVSGGTEQGLSISGPVGGGNVGALTVSPTGVKTVTATRGDGTGEVTVGILPDGATSYYAWTIDPNTGLGLAIRMDTDGGWAIGLSYSLGTSGSNSGVDSADKD